MSQNNEVTIHQIPERDAVLSDDTDHISNPISQLYLISYLTLFAISGTLARLGIQLLTSYDNAPITFNSLWYNLIGCFIMAFLVEDCIIFSYGHWTSLYHQNLVELQQNISSNRETMILDMETIKKSYQSRKKLSPLYIGLTTGFCGSFTSFSSFIRDTFLAMANFLSKNRNNIGEAPLNFPPPFNAGYSLMATISVITLTILGCFSAWLFGVHLAHILNQLKPRFSIKLDHWFICGITVFLAASAWITIILYIIFRHDWLSSKTLNTRGSILFSLAFAPSGCLCRFYISMFLNGKITIFPLGTLTSNILGTVVLGISYDLQHVPVGGIIECQVLKGIQDGFCGCLTTVSSLVAELFSLEKSHAYLYCAVSIVVCLCLLIVINGSMLWTKGFIEPICSH